MPAIQNKHTQSKGQILIVSLIFVLILMALSGVLISLIFSHTQTGRLAYAQEQALQIAEAGIDKAIYEINQPGGGSYAGEANASLGQGEFTVSIADLGSTKIIESTGSVPDSGDPQAQKKIRVVLTKSSIGASFIYGVQVGFGGLIMNNNSFVDGSVYSDGDIIGASNTQITGDAWVAGGVATTPDQEQAIQTGEQRVGEIEVNEDAAQSFVPDVTHIISRVSLLLKRVGNPFNSTVRITADNAGNPSATTLATGSLNPGSVGTGFGWVDISFSTNPTLTAGQKYWMVIDTPAPGNSKYYVWAKHDNSGYGNGVGKISNDYGASPSTWSDAFGDFGFQTWMGGGDTKISSAIVGVDTHANTIENTTISGDAYYQTITGSTVAGTSFPGSADPPAIDLPLSDSVIQDFKNSAAAGGTIVPGTGEHLLSGNVSIGPKKIEGDLRFDENAVVTLTGPLWVEGDIFFENNVIVQLDSGFGSDSTYIVADYPADTFLKGKIDLQNNTLFLGSGSPDSYILVLSTFADLNSYALDVKNNADGAIFYASAGVIHISNNVNVKEAIAYQLELANNASINYETGLSNVNFSSGPSGGWQLKRGSWQILAP